MSISELMAASLGSSVLVRSEDNSALASAVTQRGGAVRRQPDEALLVRGLEPEDIGRAAKASGLAVFELTVIRPSLEDLFVDLTAGRVEFQAQRTANGGGEMLQ